MEYAAELQNHGGLACPQGIADAFGRRAHVDACARGGTYRLCKITMPLLFSFAADYCRQARLPRLELCTGGQARPAKSGQRRAINECHLGSYHSFDTVQFTVSSN